MKSNRRRFVQNLGMLGLSTYPGLLRAPALERPGELHLSTNQYPWGVFYGRDRERFDTARVLAEVASAGISGYEPLVTSIGQLDELGPLLTEHGLEMTSLYVNSTMHEPEKVETSMDNVLEIAESAKRLGVKIIVTNPSPVSWTGPDNKDDRQLRVQAGALNRLGRSLDKLGLQLAYHNHDSELRMGAREFHHMMVGTDPDFVHLCLDAHWIFRGCGNSSVALFDILDLYAERVIEVHIRQSKDGIWTETLQDGDIDYRRLADALKQHGRRPLLVLEQSPEKETPHTLTALEAHKRTVKYARKVFGSS